jgi:hypothetical protein
MLEGSVAKGRPQSGILLPLMWCLVAEVTEGLKVNGCYRQRYVLYSLAEKFLISVQQVLLEV